MSHNPTRPRIAASSYLNTAPLIWSFQEGSQRDAVELVTNAAPSRCADLLANGDVDAALVPIIEYQRIPDVQIVPGVCVGARSAVRSVVLVSNVDDLTQVKKVALDTSSRTSQVLVKIIFAEFIEVEPEWSNSRPEIQEMMSNNDAALLIGDPAMNISEADFRIFDLASLWHQFTDLGFVFAMWMVRSSAEEKLSKINFAAARDEGLANIEKITTQYRDKVALTPSEVRSYLTKNITFDVNEQLEKGMSLYFQLAQKHGFIEVNQELRFVNA
jgi:chorismate dehydratase